MKLLTSVSNVLQLNDLNCLRFSVHAHDALNHREIFKYNSKIHSFSMRKNVGSVLFILNSLKDSSVTLKKVFLLKINSQT